MTFKNKFLIPIVILFLGCNSADQKISNNQWELQLIEAGKNIAMQTKAVLGKNLVNAIETKGTENAINFCSTKAITLTDSMAIQFNAKIKRVSDKNRNPQNIADSAALEYIRTAKSKINNGEIIKPHLSFREDKAIGYYPIMTNQLCLQCHGKIDSDITLPTFNLIQNLYPADKAVGYGINELRGIWVVEMDTIRAKIKI